MKTGQKVEREDETRDAMKLSAQSELDKSMRDVLVDPENGIMKAGLLPKVDAATSAGAKALLNSFNQGGYIKYHQFEQANFVVSQLD